MKGYFPIGGQTATHYTIRRERGFSFTSPIVDKYAPLNNVRKLSTRLVLITGDRKLEQMGRYEENLYLDSPPIFERSVFLLLPYPVQSP